MFHPGLLKLSALQWKGAFRQIGRSLKTFRGIVQFGFIAFMIGYFVVINLVARNMTGPGTKINAILLVDASSMVAFGLFAFTAKILLFSTGEAAIYFTASEVAFLFPAPLTRRQLLVYKLMKSLGGILVLGLMLSVMMMATIKLWVAGFVGLVLALSFMQLLAMNVAFAREIAGERLHYVLRRAGSLVVGVLVVVAVLQTLKHAPGVQMQELAKGFKESAMGGWLLAPFQIFSRTILAPDLPTLMTWGSIALAVDAVLLAVAFRLDALSLETALEVSEKITAKIQLAKSKGAWHMLLQPGSVKVQRRLPQLPFWRGVGPIVWQKLMTTFRSSSKILWLPIAAFIFGGIAMTMAPPPAKAGLGIGIMGYLSFIVCLSMQNDIERVGYLKSLPIGSVAVVMGELLGFVLTLSVAQSLFFIGAALALPQTAGWMACAAAFVLPFNFLLFSVDKLVFYAYPTRMMKASAGDFQQAGRQLLFVIFKTLLLGVAAMAAAMSAGLGYFVHSAIVGKSQWLVGPEVSAVAAACAALLLMGLSLIPALAYAYRRFDASLDMPA